MALTIAEEKKQLRSNIRKTLAAIPQEELTRSDDALFARFLALPQVQQAKTIFAFWGIPGKEPETARMIQTLVSQGKRVGLPRMLPGHLMEIRQYMPDRPMVSVSFGISEPDLTCPILTQDEIDLILVPAVCYDKAGYRLGFGGGYYDRWLEHFNGFRVGMCRNAVLQDKVPTEPHDSRVDLLLTETECTSIVGNLLENALRAVCALPVEAREVRVVSGMIGGAMLGLSVENGYVGEIAFAPNGLPTSHKKDHGVGLASVAATVKRHNGTFSIAAKDGVFSAHILLSL